MEYPSKVARRAGSGIFKRRWRSLRRFQLERGDATVGDAAGNDPVEVTEVRRYVKREAVRSDRLGDMDADRRDLLFRDASARVGPHTSTCADALCGHTEILAGQDQGLLHHADEVHRAEMRAFLAGKVSAQIEDGITHQLAGAMVRHIATTIDLVDLNALLRERFIAEENVRTCGVAA